MKVRFRLRHLLLLLIIVPSCKPYVVQSTARLAAPVSVVNLPTRAVTPTTSPATKLWVSPGLPLFLRDTALGWGLPVTTDRKAATLFIDLAQPAPGALRVSTWIYALVAPFPTVTDGVTSDELRAAWNGSHYGPFEGRPLLMDDSTRAAFTALWGAPASNAVRTLPADQLLHTAWSEPPSWGIIPFEALDKRWKVLTVDGESPIHKDFNPDKYSLTINYRLICSDVCPLSSLPAFQFTNRDPSLMTTLIMTGVTALVRATAETMERKGVTYPARDIVNILRDADITHISNEIPFYDACEPPDPKSTKLVFCSSPRYMDLLTFVGADVIELTGNHFADYGEIAMRQTLDLYKRAELPYFAGGMNAREAEKPLLLEDHGNKFAFIGCDRADTGAAPTATAHRSGAAPCDFQYMTGQIRQLSAQGYIVVTTFQWNESAEPIPYPPQVKDFQRMADSGASIVSGSQAHYPQIMEFRGNSFIHYGLGNLFFDQMASQTRHEFLDRYVVYDGKLISVELLTMMLEDHSRPRPMTVQERETFLAKFFGLSGWKPFLPETPDSDPLNEISSAPPSGISNR